MKRFELTAMDGADFKICFGTRFGSTLHSIVANFFVLKAFNSFHDSLLFPFALSSNGETGGAGGGGGGGAGLLALLPSFTETELVLRFTVTDFASDASIDV